MATFKATVLKNKVRRDGTYSVKIRVTHERKVSYISTPYYAKKSSLTKDLELKERDILKVTDRIIESYEKAILNLGEGVHQFNAQELADWLVKETQHIGIDFIQFSQGYIEKEKNKGKTGNAENLQTALNSLKDFLQDDKISIEEVNSKMLEKFEKYLLSERTIEREYIPGRLTKRTLAPLISVTDPMRRLRQLFKAAQDEYNDLDRGIIKIKHYPFQKYKIPKAPATKKRNLTIDQIKAIRDLSDIPDNGKLKRNQAEFARDMFILSFYLVGMNSVDLYNITNYSNGRLTYKRTKTTTRRQDEARISIKVEPEALPLIEKYKDKSRKRVFNFYQNNNSPDNFNRAINQGLKQVAELLNNKRVEIEPQLQYYYARHSWATLGRNVCRIPKDDIHFALCHSDSRMKMTDIYIDEDFTIIDEANRKVLDLLKI